jgi:ADP-ribose pyrophosphatase YjhB (NUDIX family)
MNYNDTDDGFFFDRKNRFMGYTLCPRCGSKLAIASIDGRSRPKCTNENCDFIYYNNPVPAAGALVIKDGQVLLVRRAHQPKKGWWGLPAGFMEWGEHPADTAIREVEEETGLKIKLKSLFEVYSGNDDPRTNAILVVYLATILGGDLRPADDAEEVRFFNFDDLPDNIAFISNRQALEDYRTRVIKNIASQ